MSTDLISVIVPIYNVEKYLNRCVDSIINQTYKNLEIILVDDGSPDNCGKICDEYAKKDKRIKVIHKKNGGLSDARNAGIDLAKGKYIGFVDSDDYIEKDMYSYLYNLVLENNAQISICNWYEVNENERIDKNIKFNDFTIGKDRAIEMLIQDKIIKNYAWNKLYDISLFKKYDIRYPYGRKMEDVGTTYKLFYYSKKIAIGNKPEYNYIIRSNSIMNSKNFQFYVDYYEIMYERYNFLESVR